MNELIYFRTTSGHEVIATIIEEIQNLYYVINPYMVIYTYSSEGKPAVTLHRYFSLGEDNVPVRISRPTIEATATPDKSLTDFYMKNLERIKIPAEKSEQPRLN